MSSEIDVKEHNCPFGFGEESPLLSAQEKKAVKEWQLESGGTKASLFFYLVAGAFLEIREEAIRGKGGEEAVY